MTLRVAEEEVEAEEDLVTPEAPSNPRIGAEVEAIRKNTVNGMPHSHLALVEGDQFKPSLRGHGGVLTKVQTTTVKPRKGLRTETPKIFPPTTPKNLMTGKGPEAPAPERIDIEEKEAMTDMTPEEAIMMRAESPVGTMGPAQAVETTAQAEENMIKTDMAEETRAQDIDLAPDPDIQEKNLQMKAGDTLVTIGDGDAKGP